MLDGKTGKISSGLKFLMMSLDFGMIPCPDPAGVYDQDPAKTHIFVGVCHAVRVSTVMKRRDDGLYTYETHKQALDNLEKWESLHRSKN